MDCEFTVELGTDDPTLAIPWRSPDANVAYVDLKAHPEAIVQLPEVQQFPELGDFLIALNSGLFATAKCDAWFDTLMDVDDDPYEAAIKCASYVDVFFSGERKPASFEQHEQLAHAAVQRIRAAEDLRARSEIAIRRAWFEEEVGFYWTIYAFGYGDDQVSSLATWSKSLQILMKCLI
jgi:hypothetical protein